MKFHSAENFNRAVLNWYDLEGRKNLPWQKPITPYRVWVSEIMLQQTQVSTVIGYYKRFMARFPSLQALAEAPQDEVLQHWSGLGYYARARNLHKTARLVMADYQGKFPHSVELLSQLPGIGRSTAGAIAAISMGIPASILDGNVKRVLSRYHRIPGWPGSSKTLKQLWHAADHYTPQERTGAYTQAMMDLGATICTRGKPSCLLCPLQPHCEAFKHGETDQFPQPKAKKTLPTKSTFMLLVENDRGELLLQKRPPSGIWGGLWSLPEVKENPSKISLQAAFGWQIKSIKPMSSLRHSFSHYHLAIQPLHVEIADKSNRVMEASTEIWYNPEQPADIGLPAPVTRLITAFNEPQQFSTQETP